MRLNPSQLYEHELNFIAQEIVKATEDKVDTMKLLVDFLTYCSPDQHKMISEMAGKDFENTDFIESFIDDVRKDGLYIHQNPFFENITFESLCEMYLKFGVKKIKFDGINEPLVKANIYYIKLIIASLYSNV